MTKQKPIKCTCCGKRIGLFHQGLVLTDHREKEPKLIGEWCGEQCLSDWLDTPEAMNLLNPSL